MSQYVFSALFWWAILWIIALLLHLAGRAKLDWRWMLASTVIFAIYIFANRLGRDLFSVEMLLGDTLWNWEGKASEILVTLIMAIILIKGLGLLSLEALGFTWKQRHGSMKPSIIVAGVLVGLAVVIGFLSNDDRLFVAETALYQASMPGLSEEFFYRGLLLGTMSAAVVSGGKNLWGANITWAGVLMSLLFGFGHGLFISTNGGTDISLENIVITGIVGFILYWLRARTGSILIPIITHNLFNLGITVFPTVL